MIIKNAYKKLTWIDISSPDKNEVRKIAEEYGLTTTIADELLAPSEKPQVELYKDHIYLVLHFPAVKHSHNGSPEQEVNFIIGKDYLITVRYDEIDPLHKFSKIFEVNSILDKHTGSIHAGHIFFHMIRKLYASLIHEIEYMSDELDVIEENIFAGNEKEMVNELSGLVRAMLNMKHTLISHDETLDSLSLALEKLFGKNFTESVEHIRADYYRVGERLEALQELARELRMTNDSLLTTKQNEIMKILTIMAFVTFPLSLIAGIFGMNTLTTPIVGQENDFWMVIGIMLILTALFFLFFRYRRWL